MLTGRERARKLVRLQFSKRHQLTCDGAGCDRGGAG